MKPNEKGMHDGHRERLLDLGINAGLDNMSDYQVVELFLTYILPRGDVNPLSHRLLNNYEDFSNILDANILDLVNNIYGINDRSAKKISLFKEFLQYYTNSRLAKKKSFGTYGEIIDLCEELVRFRNSENIVMIALSSANRCIQKRILSDKSSNSVSLTIADLSAFLLSTKASKIVFAHCHPYGVAKPSDTDMDSYIQSRDFCKIYGVQFVDSYIVGLDGVYSCKEEKLLRVFMDVEYLAESLSSLPEESINNKKVE